MFVTVRVHATRREITDQREISHEMQHLGEECGSGDREEDVQDERGGDHDGLRLGKAVRVGALVGS